MVNKIDELKLQLFDLQRNIAETEQRIESISRRKKELEDSGFTDRNLNDELLSLTSTLHALYNDLTVLNDNEELYWALPAVKSNGVVELRVRSFAFNGDTFDLINTYDICLCSNRKVVGYIDYRGYHSIYSFGDIAYAVDPEFRGNNYSYQALCLLGELLKENGIDDFFIYVEKDNTASNIVVQKYGGKIIRDLGYINHYFAETFIDTKEKSSSEYK